MLSSAQLAALAEAAGDHGAPVLELTSRGNVQLRSVRDANAVGALLSEAGLLPSPSHERVRNIVASRYRDGPAISRTHARWFPRLTAG